MESESTFALLAAAGVMLGAAAIVLIGYGACRLLEIGVDSLRKSHLTRSVQPIEHSVSRVEHSARSIEQAPAVSEMSTSLNPTSPLEVRP